MPLGLVKVDFSNQLAAGCKSFWLFRGSGMDTPTRSKDLLNHKLGITRSNIYIFFNPEYVYTYGNQYFTCDWGLGAVAAPYTILVGFDWLSGGISWSWMTESGWYGIYSSGADNQFNVTNAADFAVSATIPAGSRFSNVDFMAITIRGNNNCAAASNGGPIFNDTSMTAPAFTPTGFRGAWSCNVDSVSLKGEVNIACFAYWNRAFSDAELQAISRDPYQFLTVS
jgi:hypothetical protein